MKIITNGRAPNYQAKPAGLARQRWAKLRAMGKTVATEMAQTLLVTTAAQSRALEKRLEAQQPIGARPTQRATFRHWDSMTSLFESMGPHPLTRSDVYQNRVVRGHFKETDPKSLRNRVTMENLRVGMKVGGENVRVGPWRTCASG